MNVFTKNANLKKKLGGGGGDKWTDRPKPISPFNFFEVGGITMHKCTSSIYDHFIIWPSTVTLTFNIRKQMF